MRRDFCVDIKCNKIVVSKQGTDEHIFSLLIQEELTDSFRTCISLEESQVIAGQEVEKIIKILCCREVSLKYDGIRCSSSKKNQKQSQQDNDNSGGGDDINQMEGFAVWIVDKGHQKGKEYRGRQDILESNKLASGFQMGL